MYIQNNNVDDAGGAVVVRGHTAERDARVGDRQGPVHVVERDPTRALLSPFGPFEIRDAIIAGVAFTFGEEGWA